jgi:hypothetical protein
MTTRMPDDDRGGIHDVQCSGTVFERGIAFHRVATRRKKGVELAVEIGDACFNYSGNAGLGEKERRRDGLLHMLLNM